MTDTKTTNTRTALEIAVEALTNMSRVIDNGGIPECLACGSEMQQSGHAANCLGYQAREALASMRTAPGLADTIPALDDSERKTLQAFEALQRTKAGLK